MNSTRNMLLVACFAAVGGAGCSCEPEELELGAQCDLTSDCSRPYVCRLERCRNECAEDVDCPPGTFCVSDNDGLGSCLLPDETNCGADRDCPADLSCAPDRVCRRECVNDDVCLRSQMCIDSFCAEPEDGTDGGVPGDGAADDAAGDVDAGDCAPPRMDCNGDPSDGCEVDTSTDVLHCGECANECLGTAPNAGAACVDGTCGVACVDGFDDCNADLALDGCETPTSNDEANCGGCGIACSTAQACVASACRAHAFPSGGTEAFEPAGSMSIVPDTYEYTSIHIPADVTIATSVGSGFLELYASGDIVIEGTIDVSGGAGANVVIIGTSPGGGATGAPVDAMTTGDCGEPGPGGVGVEGEQGPGAPAGCALGGRYGGGMGGRGSAGGGGGGGRAGGGGGGSAVGAGGAGASAGTDMGGAGGAMCMGGGGGVAPGPYAGSDGSGDCSLAAAAGGGGGGSIGAAAAADLAVETTFYPGSGGGGGGARDTGTGGGGGGGGGGAIRLASATRIRVTGSILANGGNGGGPPTSPSGGGGGSGGVVYLAAPELEVTGAGRIDVDGGRGGAVAGKEGGDGGLGRIRVSTDPSTCTLRGSFGGIETPTACELTPAAAPGQIYVGLYPD